LARRLGTGSSDPRSVAVGTFKFALPSGQAFLKQDGFALITPPKVTGSGIPATVQSALP